jgi:hypothetical protein
MDGIRRRNGVLDSTGECKRERIYILILGSKSAILECITRALVGLWLDSVSL